MTRRTVIICGAFLLVLTAAILRAPWRRCEGDCLGSPAVPVATGTPAREAPAVPEAVEIPFAEARPILALAPAGMPPELAGKSTDAQAQGWSSWLRSRSDDVNGRLRRGDEDSIVNFWKFGTSFTALPRATERDLSMAGGPDGARDLLLGRLDDLIDGAAAPGSNERLQFVREVIQQKGIDLSTEPGQNDARNYLIELRARSLAETAKIDRALSTAKKADTATRLKVYASVYRERGLSSDTSVNADFAIDTSLGSIATYRRIQPGGVQHVGIVGPGLDFTDKAEGYDFYPEQTLQPFAVIDSLFRTGLSVPGRLKMTTLDVSPRVNGHLDKARERATRGQGYELQLPLTANDPLHTWTDDLTAYWTRLGSAIGSVSPRPAPAGLGDVRVRAVNVRPDVVAAITPRRVNIVTERLAPLTEDRRFDLIVSTNVLLYYSPFEQALALSNVASMLKPGGFFLTNYLVTPLPPLEPTASLVTTVAFDRQGNGDTLFLYQKK